MILRRGHCEGIEAGCAAQRGFDGLQSRGCAPGQRSRVSNSGDDGDREPCKGLRNMRSLEICLMKGILKRDRLGGLLNGCDLRESRESRWQLEDRQTCKRISKWQRRTSTISRKFVIQEHIYNYVTIIRPMIYFHA